MKVVWGIIILLTGISVQDISGPKIKPPGTVPVNDTLFIDQTEVANIHWREYLHYLLSVEKDTIAYAKAFPDTTVWEIDIPGDPLTEFYLRHPAFNSYPVVGVSYEQAIEFCKWRTLAANALIYSKEKKIEQNKVALTDNFPIRFIYRLPAREEWETVAAAGIDSTKRTFKKYFRKTSYPFNTKERTDSLKGKISGHYRFISVDQISQVQSYFVNKYGTYNITGNVAEMTNEKGIAKGGSFEHTLDSSKAEMNQHYSKPEKWLGFRCVAVMKK